MQSDAREGGKPRRRAPQRPCQAENRPVPGNHRRLRTLGGIVGEGRDPLPLSGGLRAVTRLRFGTVPRTGGYVNF